MKNGVTYHQLSVPDTQDPKMMKCEDFFERVCIFIDGSLKHRGNILVHCEQGHRRSPAAMLAWMLTLQGCNDIQKCLSIFSSTYSGKNGKNWGKVYREERPEWIEKLEKWTKNWKPSQIEWIKSNENLVKTWKAFWTAKKKKEDTNSPPTKKLKSSH